MRIKNSLYRTYIPILLLALLTACSVAPASSTPTPPAATPTAPELVTATPTPVPVEATATPTPVPPTETPTSAPPTPTPTRPTPVPTATRTTTEGQVRGFLLNLRTEQPFADREVVLAIVQSGQDARQVSLEGGPRTLTDEMGAFRFENVPPGQYVLAALLPDPVLWARGEEPILVEVAAGQLLDLGPLMLKTP